ncbi:hypothetical protein FLAG1_00410 [Fusarium langsethiae]|uniref:Uncharacterized protein n=1 Tax=Fusarium langsethiae TaxID=179993 RepID=A0A0M9F5J7_FUSLA|nr:hypothetical protein FLAG1_00410 [Fusarium langsethiae]GKT98299.1 unnamed protein product [Fusarium langsethiae]GKU13295.1 unnamed protein product [Fusarium langsethiae]
MPSSPEGIWVTNAMLARAIERFHHVYPVPRRSLSSCPGPLESRRRLGKRHMTAIVPNSHASPFPWSIDLPIDLGKWTWEAPTRPQDRRHKKVGLFERFLRSLEGIDCPENPSITTTAVSQTATLSPIEQVLVELSGNLASFEDVGDGRALYKACEPYLLKVLDMIDAKTISADDLILSLNPFDEAIKSRISAKVLDYVLARQWVSIIHCIHDNRIRPTSDVFGGHLWYQCLKTAFQMTPQATTFNFLDELLRLTRQFERILLDPDDYVALMRAHLVLETCRAQQEPSRPVPTRILRRNMYLSRMFGLAGLSNMNVYQQLSRSCLENSTDATGRRTMAYHFLLKLATTPGLKIREFAELVRDTLDTSEWTESEVWQFAALRLMNQSQWKLRPEYLQEWSEKHSTLHSWAALIDSAFHRHAKKRKANLRALSFTSDICGQLGTLMKAVRLLPNHNEIVSDMVKTEEDPHHALTIWEFYNEEQTTPDKLPWHAWARHTEVIVTDVNLPADLIWRVAEFHPQRSLNKLNNPIRHGTVYTMDFLVEIGKLYMRRPGMTSRARLRYIEKVINFGKASRQPMPQSLMQILAEIILKDLEMGKMGRKARLAYLVSKIEQFCGKEQAQKVAASIDGWRWTNRNRMTQTLPMPSSGGSHQQKKPRRESIGHSGRQSYRRTKDKGEGNNFESLLKSERRQAQIPAVANASF